MRLGRVSIASCSEIRGAAVVVDVLRAFSTAAYAAAWGARHLLLVASVGDAVELAGRRPGALTMKDGPAEPGVDLVNSPAHLRAADVDGKVIVQSTQNGTVGALAARHASPLLCASFVNAAATARYLLRHGVDAVTFVITGDDGRAEEDLACADYIGDLLTVGPEADPRPYLEAAGRSRLRHDLDRGAAAGYTGVHPDDVGLCLAADVVPLALVASPEDDHVIVLPVSA